MNESDIYVPPFHVGRHLIYHKFVSAYAKLMSYHDFESNIYRSLLPYVKQNTTLIDCGCGTGRIAKLFYHKARKIFAYDASSSMINYLTSQKYPNLRAEVACLGNEKPITETKNDSSIRNHSSFPQSSTNFSLPKINLNLPDFSFKGNNLYPKCGVHQKCPIEGGNRTFPATISFNPLKSSSEKFVIVAAWSLSYVKQDNWGDPKWKKYISRVIKAWERNFDPEYIIIFETLGTGTKVPTRKGDILAHEPEFRSVSIRTDFLFPNFEEAKKFLVFFFGEKATTKFLNKAFLLNKSKNVCVPEVTGMYVKDRKKGRDKR